MKALLILIAMLTAALPAISCVENTPNPVNPVHSLPSANYWASPPNTSTAAPQVFTTRVAKLPASPVPELPSANYWATAIPTPAKSKSSERLAYEAVLAQSGITPEAEPELYERYIDAFKERQFQEELASFATTATAEAKFRIVSVNPARCKNCYGAQPPSPARSQSQAEDGERSIWTRLGYRISGLGALGTAFLIWRIWRRMLSVREESHIDAIMREAADARRYPGTKT